MCKIIRRQIIIIITLALDEDSGDDGNECKGDFIHSSHTQRELPRLGKDKAD